MKRLMFFHCSHHPLKNTDLSELNIKMEGTLANDYNGETNTGKGIKFGKNADGSYFTLRPYLPNNIMQITKNDNTSLFSVDTSGNGTLGNNTIITSGNIKSQSVNYATAASRALSKYNGFYSPICVCLSDNYVQFMWNTTKMTVDVYVDKTYIGHIVTN